MNSFYSREELKTIGFKSIGTDVLISRKVSIYDPVKISISSNVRIDDFCILSGEVELGSHIHIAAYCALYGKNKIVMEDFTGLSPRCTIFSSSDNFNGDFLISPMTLLEDNDFIKGKVHLKKFVQIGTHSVLMPNITLEVGSVLGANSLLKENTEAWNIYAGSPAVKIKQRNKGLLNKIKKYE